MAPQTNAYIKQLVRLLGPLREQDVAYLASIMSERLCRARERLFSAGDASDSVYLLVGGRVKLCAATENGKEVILDILRSGDIVGESALTGERARRASAEALDDSRLICFSTADFERLMLRLPQLSVAVSKVMARRLQAAQEQLQSQVVKTVAGRLATLLRDEAQRQRVWDAALPILDLDLTHQEIAQWLGTSRETVTALLSRFSSLGIIATDRRRLVIRDRVLLERCARDQLHVSPRQPAPLLQPQRIAFEVRQTA